jgi:hypothetical protein
MEPMSDSERYAAEQYETDEPIPLYRDIRGE